MNRISLHFDIKSLAAKFKSNTALVFYVALALILFLEIFIFYGAGKNVVVSREAVVDDIAPRGVRLNFGGYEQAIKRIEAGKKFYPGPPIFENPFGSK